MNRTVGTTPRREDAVEAQADGLVPSRVLELKDARVKRAPLLVLVFFGLWTAGVGVLDIIRPSPQILQVGRRHLDDQRLRETARIQDGSQMAIWSSDLQQRSNVQLTLSSYYAVGLLKIFREGTNFLIVGDNDWLFFRNRAVLRPGEQEPRYAALGARYLSAIARRTEALGIETLLLPIPRKAVIASEYLPPDPNWWPQFDRHVLEELKRFGVPHVDLLNSMGERDATEVWYPLDTHWSRRGQQIAAEQTARRLDSWVPLAQRAAMTVEDDTVIEKFGSLWYAGVHRKSSANGLMLPTAARPEIALRDRTSGEAWLMPAVDPNSWLGVTGTSFIAAGQFVPLLAHATQRPVQNLSARGYRAMSMLAKSLAAGKTAGVQRLVVGMPMYQLPFTGKAAGRILVTEDLTEPLLHTDGLKLWELKLQAGDEQRLKRQAVPTGSKWSLPEGLLATRGDGAAQLLLTRPAQQAQQERANRVHLDTSEVSLRVRSPWRRLVLPILDAKDGSPSVRIGLFHENNPKPMGVKLVTELDLAHGLRLSGSVRKTGPHRWKMDLLFDTPRNLDPRSALHIQLLADRELPHPVDVVLLSTVSTETTGITRFQLKRGGTALLTLAASDGTWRGIRLSGTGRRPAHLERGLVQLVSLPGRL